MTTACLAPNGMNVYRGNAASTRLLVGTAKGISMVERGPGGEWSVAGLVLDGPHISSMLIEPIHGGIYAGVHGGGVFYSGDGGVTWEERSEGIRVKHVFSVGCAVENGKPVIIAGTEPVSAFKSYDQGRTWEECPDLRDMPGKEKWMFPMPPHIAHVKVVTVDPRDPKTFYAGVEQGGLFKTRDGGATWRELDGYSKPEDLAYRDIHQVVLRPNHPDEVFLTSGNGLYRSPDGGEHWEQLTQRGKFRLGYPDKLIFSPEDDRTMYICGSHDNPGTWITRHTANATVMRSTDLGESWEIVGNGLPEPMTANIEAMCMYVGPNGFELFGGTTDGKVYLTDDGAKNWRLVAGELAPVSKVAHFRLLLPGAVSSRGNRPPQAPSA
jgi:photosystem II stability/assembly factor-like uncharacterized protein